jgi:fatty acid desaturase
MDEQFHDSQRSIKDGVRALGARSDGPALGKFVVQYALFLASAAIVVTAPANALPLWQTALGFAGVGFSVMAMFAATHETAHTTAFKSVTLNTVALWLASAPFLYIPTGFREFHFAHHRHTHEPGRDPEISMAGKPAPGVTSNIGIYAGFLSGLPLMAFKITLLIAASIGGPKVLWETFLFYVTPRARRRLMWEARGVLLLHAGIVTVGVLWVPGLLYLYAAQWLGHSMLSFYIMAEHNGLPHEGNVLARTRTMRTNGFVRWLMWNMPYHTEHHAYPAVPWHALPKLNRLLEPELVNVGTGYTAFHLRALGMLVRGRPFRE